MTSFDADPSFGQFLTYKLGKLATARRDSKQRNARAASMTGQAAASAFSSFLMVVLHLAGFGCLTYAGFTISITVGWVLAGISCFVLATLARRKPSAVDQTGR